MQGVVIVLAMLGYMAFFAALLWPVAYDRGPVGYRRFWTQTRVGSAAFRTLLGGLVALPLGLVAMRFFSELTAR